MEGLNMDWIGADWKGWGMELMDIIIQFRVYFLHMII
jgi:hypothetical protein